MFQRKSIRKFGIFVFTCPLLLSLINCSGGTKAANQYGRSTATASTSTSPISSTSQITLPPETPTPSTPPVNCADLVPRLTPRAIPAGWVLPETDGQGNPVYIEVVDKDMAMLTQVYNEYGAFKLAKGLTVQTSRYTSPSASVRVKVSTKYDMATGSLIEGCPMTLRPSLNGISGTTGDTFCANGTAWNGSLQVQTNELGEKSNAVLDGLIEAMQACSDRVNPGHTIGTELFRQLPASTLAGAGARGYITRIGFGISALPLLGSLNMSLIPGSERVSTGSISQEASEDVASALRECAQAYVVKHRDVLVGFKPCQCDGAW